jgi:hypothetical protein
MKLIENHQSYTNTFRELAMKHKKLQHLKNGEDDIHFVRATLSRHPMLSEGDLREFIKGLRNKIKFPAMVLVAYGSGYSAANHDAKRKQIQGEFFILDRVQKDDYDDIDLKLDETEQIGEEIMAFLGDWYEENEYHGLFQWDEAQNEKISNLGIDNLAGTKFYLTIDIPHQAKLSNFRDAFNFETQV